MRLTRSLGRGVSNGTFTSLLHRVLIMVHQARGWIRRLLGGPRSDPPGIAPVPARRRLRLALMCAVIFTLAFGIRLLHWQDKDLEIQGNGPSHLLNRMALHYHREARRMIDQGGIIFSYPDNPGDAHPILHPPGYSILLAVLYGSEGFSGSYHLLRLLQVICDAAAAVLLFLTAAELVPIAVAAIAGCMVALSPQLAYYSLWLTPESLSALLILMVIYLLIRATAAPKLTTVLMLGVTVGLSCWLRSINLFLAPFVCLVFLVSSRSRKRLSYSAAFLAAAVAVITPITVRNWLAYHRFIPLSIGSGITLIEGIAEYDTEGRFGLPRIDNEAKAKDVEWYGRPDYGASPWAPDGVERDCARFARGLAVVRSNPVWFLGIMLQRGASMLRYNDSLDQGWPADSSKVPIIEREPPVARLPAVEDGAEPGWRNSPEDLVATGKTVSALAEVSLDPRGTALRVLGDDSAFGDQFVSGPIAVQPYTDYVLKVPVDFERGSAAIKVTSSDRRTTLAAAFRSAPEDSESGPESDPAQKTPTDPTTERFDPIQISFASGGRSGLRLVISNNGLVSARPVSRVGVAELFPLGPTFHLWSRYVRPIARSIQRRLFTTSGMLALIAAGILLLAAAGRGRALLFLLAIPIYYLCTQSALHTEYRYTLPIHYFLFVMAGVTLYCAWGAVSFAARQVTVRLARRARQSRTQAM